MVFISVFLLTGDMSTFARAVLFICLPEVRIPFKVGLVTCGSGIFFVFCAFLPPTIRNVLESKYLPKLKKLSM